MITKFHTFEKYQLDLFPSLEPTDTEIALTLVSKHKLNRRFPQQGKQFRTLIEAFEDWSNNNEINDNIENELLEGGLDSSEMLSIMMGHPELLIEYVDKNPKEAIDKWQAKLKRNKKKTLDEIQKFMENDDEWYYHIEDYIKNDYPFVEFVVKSLKNNLFDEIDNSYYYELKEAILDSEDETKLHIFRAITLPDTIDELEKIKENGVGICWTYEEEKAEAYNSQHDKGFMLEGYADVNSIDWSDTIFRSVYGLKDEKEIKLIRGAEVELISIFMTDAYNNFIPEKEMTRLKTMFGISDDQAFQYVQGKQRRMSNLKFDEPTFIRA